MDYLEENGHFGTIVLDEAHYIKGRSIRAKSTIEISGMAPRVYCLTGTPLLNRPIELFNILKAIGHYLGKNRTEYAYRYCGAFWMIQFQDRSSNRKFFTTQDKAKFYYGSKQYRQTLRFLDESGATNLDELRKNLKGCMQRIRKEDVLNLPPKIIDVQEVEMNNLQRREYDNAWDNYLDFLRANPPEDTTIENIMATRQLVEITKLKQICSRAKIDRIVSDSLNAIEQNNKVIIFSQYTDTIDYIAKGLREEKIQVATLKGENDQSERQEAVDQFQTNPKVMAFVANIKAAGVGITLSKGSIVIFADMDWSPEVHTQAEDRAHRIGTTGTVNVHYYICKNTIEEDIVEILTYKKQIVQEVIDGTKKRVETGSAVHDFLKRMNDRARL
jgi:SWI/SNF-related matrix-associated actin-dependent regulator 1 of chromatin subfamily A